MIQRCVVCNHKLTTPESKDQGVGAICAKKLSREALIEIRDIIHQGHHPRLMGDGVIQLSLPEFEEEHPEIPKEETE